MAVIANAVPLIGPGSGPRVLASLMVALRSRRNAGSI
jgi:hypothetical protein